MTGIEAKKKRKKKQQVAGARWAEKKKFLYVKENWGKWEGGRSTRVQRVYQSYLLVGMALRGIGRYPSMGNSSCIHCITIIVVIL